MVKQKWFRNTKFIVTLLGIISAALAAAVREATQRFGFGHKKGGNRKQRK